MSVYTLISTESLTQFLTSYAVGELINYEGVTEGVTNTIYKIKTTRGQFVLTLFEDLSEEQLGFFVTLQISLLKKGLKLPKIVGVVGCEIKCLAGKPAILSEFLPGVSPSQPTRQQASEIGVALAVLHNAVTDFPLSRENPFSLSWHNNLAITVMPYLTDGQKVLLQSELSYQAAQNYTELPSGIIHMDLFPDNVLFMENTLSALLDFYFACHDAFVYNLAIAMNSWSLTEKGINNTSAEMLLVAYQMERSLSKLEMQQLKNLSRYAALHFWLTRLRDQHLMTAKEGVQVKPAEALEALLLHLQ
jgi:homoserine kinase type II